MTDHKAEAELLNTSERTAGGVRWFAHDADRYAAAQVHATLYLAEQQRIANVLAAHHPVIYQNNNDSVNALISIYPPELRKSIAKSLGFDA